MERFNLKKLNEVEVKERYRVDTSNGFAAFENLRPRILCHADHVAPFIRKSWQRLRREAVVARSV
jgi:hypothetical protein